MPCSSSGTFDKGCWDDIADNSGGPTCNFGPSIVSVPATPRHTDGQNVVATSPVGCTAPSMEARNGANRSLPNHFDVSSRMEVRSSECDSRLASDVVSPIPVKEKFFTPLSSPLKSSLLCVNTRKVSCVRENDAKTGGVDSVELDVVAMCSDHYRPKVGTLERRWMSDGEIHDESLPDRLYGAKDVPDQLSDTVTSCQPYGQDGNGLEGRLREPEDEAMPVIPPPELHLRSLQRHATPPRSVVRAVVHDFDDERNSGGNDAEEVGGVNSNADLISSPTRCENVCVCNKGAEPSTERRSGCTRIGGRSSDPTGVSDATAASSALRGWREELVVLPLYDDFSGCAEVRRSSKRRRCSADGYSDLHAASKERSEIEDRVVLFPSSALPRTSLAGDASVKLKNSGVPVCGNERAQPEVQNLAGVSSSFQNGSTLAATRTFPVPQLRLPGISIGVCKNEGKGVNLGEADACVCTLTKSRDWFHLDGRVGHRLLRKRKRGSEGAGTERFLLLHRPGGGNAEVPLPPDDVALLASLGTALTAEETRKLRKLQQDQRDRVAGERALVAATEAAGAAARADAETQVVKPTQPQMSSFTGESERTQLSVPIPSPVGAKFAGGSEVAPFAVKPTGFNSETSTVWATDVRFSDGARDGMSGSSALGTSGITAVRRTIENPPSARMKLRITRSGDGASSRPQNNNLFGPSPAAQQLQQTQPAGNLLTSPGGALAINGGPNHSGSNGMVAGFGPIRPVEVQPIGQLGGGVSNLDASANPFAVQASRGRGRGNRRGLRRR